MGGKNNSVVYNSIDIEDDSFYAFDKPKERTKERLIRMKNMGLEDCGFACFGKPGIVSGLYIEKVWFDNDVDFDDYIEWMQSVIDEKGYKNGK